MPLRTRSTRTRKIMRRQCRRTPRLPPARRKSNQPDEQYPQRVPVVHAAGRRRILLPEMMLVLFAMGILLSDYLLEARDKYFNALMAMLGVIFSAICLWRLRPAAESGRAFGFSASLVVDPFFLF